MTCVISIALHWLAVEYSHNLCPVIWGKKMWDTSTSFSDEVGGLIGFTCWLATCSQLSEAINGAIFSNFEWLQSWNALPVGEVCFPLFHPSPVIPAASPSHMPPFILFYWNRMGVVLRGDLQNVLVTLSLLSSSLFIHTCSDCKAWGSTNNSRFSALCTSQEWEK